MTLSMQLDGSALSNMLAASTGATTKDLMRRMGHDNERAALIYQHATSKADRAIAEGLHDLLKAQRDDPEDDGVVA